MPHRPYWFDRISLIERWLEAISEPLLSRRMVEEIFAVRQTEAQRLLRRMGAFNLGGALVVTRGQAIEWVGRLRRTGRIADEVKRAERLESVLQMRPKVRAMKMILPVERDPGMTLAGLPESVRLFPGRLEDHQHAQ